MSGGQDTSPSITVSHMGREFDAATLLGAGKIQDTCIDAGDIVNAALARGEKSVEFKLYSKCPDGAVPENHRKTRDARRGVEHRCLQA